MRTVLRLNILGWEDGLVGDDGVMGDDGAVGDDGVGNDLRLSMVGGWGRARRCFRLNTPRDDPLFDLLFTLGLPDV